VIWLVILVALLIPLTAVVLDSPVVRSWVDRRREGDLPVPTKVKELADKVGVIEAELEDVKSDVRQLREAQQFVQHLLENPTQGEAEARKLPKPPP
jgi:hypothetical protein